MAVYASIDSIVLRSSSQEISSGISFNSIIAFKFPF
jgi:hypothetical protein